MPLLIERGMRADEHPGTVQLVKREAEYFSVEDIAGRIDNAEHPPGGPKYLSGMIARYDLQALIEIRNGDQSIAVRDGGYFCPVKKQHLHERLSLCRYCVSKEIAAVSDDAE